LSASHLPPGQFYGQVVRARRVGGLLLSETRYSARVCLPRHAHANAYFCLVRRGGFTEVYGSHTRACGPMTVAFHPPGEEHSEHFQGEESRSFNVEVAPAWLQRVREVSPVLDRPADFQGGALAFLAVKLYREFQEADAVAPLAVEGLALEIVAEASRQLPCGKDRRPPRWLEHARDYLHAHFHQPVALAELAGAAGVHPVHLASTFRHWYRCPVGDYVRRLRVEFACRELATAAPLAEIALAAGFADQSHFTRTFKQHLGLTPAAYRRLMAS
jgi:AraC family transcriptional regulator